MALAKRVESSVRRKVVAAMTFSLDALSPAYGSIVLEGLVEDHEKKSDAEKIAKAHPGVTKVENNIRVLPPRAG